MSKIVVIGANHAGTACVNTILGSYGADNEVVVFDQNSNISFLGCGIALWVGQQIDGSEGLFYSDKAQLEAAGATVHMRTAVESVDFDAKEVHVVADGVARTESYDKLILATGSSPIVPSIAGLELVEGTREFRATLDNVQFIKLYQNAAEMVDKLQDESIRRIAVIGAGYIGVELAEAFERLGREVTLIDVAQVPLEGYYDPDFGERMRQTLAEHGIRLALGQRAVAVEGDGRVERLVTDKETFDVDMVVVSTGFRPNNELGRESLELFDNGAYLVDLHQRTSREDVYAIGDCATVHDNAADASSYIALATNAVRSGVVAAHNACGTALESAGVQGSNGVCIYDLKMVSTGLTSAEAREAGYDPVVTEFTDLQRPEFMQIPNHPVTIKIVFDRTSRVLLGCQMASQEDISMMIHTFSLAIQEKLTIDKLALLDIFFLPHFNKPYNYVTMAALTAPK